MRFYFANFSQFKMSEKNDEKRKRISLKGTQSFCRDENSFISGEKREKITFFGTNYNDDELFKNL